MEITNLEIKHLVDEMQFLKGGTIEGVCHKDKDMIIKISQDGRYNLFVSPNMICLTDKERVREVTEFAMLLRKYLKGKKIENIVQHNFDKIVEVWTADSILILELDTVNYVLCDRSYKIIRPMQFQKFDDRNVMAGERYIYPQGLDIRDIEVVKKWLKNSETVLNLLTNFFGRYARDVLVMAKIDKNKIARELDHDDIMKLKGNINLFIFGKRQPQIVYKDNKFDVLLFDLETRGADRKRYFDSYTEALGHFLANEWEMERKIRTEKKRVKKKKKRLRKKVMKKKKR